jgi:hypothetical protein
MPTPTYTPMANITLGSSAASVTFSSISQAYRDLVLVFSVVRTAGTTAAVVRLNGDSTSGTYQNIRAGGDGTTASSDTFNDINFFSPTPGFSSTGTVPSTSIWNFMDYSATDKHKTVLSRTNISNLGTAMHAGRWGNTSAITSITITTLGNPNWDAGSSFALYGIAS